MYPLVESIKAEDGQVFLLDYHQDRLERSFLDLYHRPCPWRLKDLLTSIPLQGLYKIRFLYNESAYSIEVLPYVPKEIKSLQLIEIGEYCYPYKWTDRSFINAAYAKRGNCDDILMTREGLLTDTSYANIVLFDGSKWVTPAIPLFEGVLRSYLLDHNIIQPVNIAITDLSHYQGFQLINAMNPFNKNRLMGVKGIVK